MEYILAALFIAIAVGGLFLADLWAGAEIDKLGEE